MMNILRRVAAAALFALALICFFMISVFRFANPDMAETRLFLECWPVIGVFGASLFASAKLWHGELK